MHIRSYALCTGLVVLSFGAGCDFFEDIGDKFTSTGQAASILTRTPSLGNAQDLDPNLVAALPLDAMAANVTGVLVALGERDDPLSTQAPTPITDAAVSIAFDGTTVDLCTGPEAGTYVATNQNADPCGDTVLAYQAGTTYTTQIRIDDHTATLKVVAPSAIEPAKVSFSPTFGSAADYAGASMKSHPANTKLTVDWGGDPSAGKPTFVALFRARYTGPADGQGALNSANWQADTQPIFDNRPTEPRDIIDLVLGNAPTSADVPASVFDQTGVYFLVLTRAELSTDTDGLAVGSGAMAGVGTVFAFWVE